MGCGSQEKSRQGLQPLQVHQSPQSNHLSAAWEFQLLLSHSTGGYAEFNLADFNQELGAIKLIFIPTSLIVPFLSLHVPLPSLSRLTAERIKVVFYQFLKVVDSLILSVSQQRIQPIIQPNRPIDMDQLDHFTMFGIKSGGVQDFQMGKKCSMGVKQIPHDPT